MVAAFDANWEPVEERVGDKIKAGAQKRGVEVSDQEVFQATRDSLRALMMIRSYRIRGHLEADLDPLKLREPTLHPELSPKTYGFGEQDMDRPIFIDNVLGVEQASLREILRIVRSLAQYLYPQKQTKVMNEGCATFVHHYIVHKLYDDKLLTDGAMLEILHNHSNVVFQPEFDDPRYAGINPYALGFDMMQDIRRIASEPTDEDREWFPEFAGNGDWRQVLKEAWSNYRDESFILQYLSPTLIRKWKLFVLDDDAAKSHYTVSQIHDERGFRRVRQALAENWSSRRLAKTLDEQAARKRSH